MSDLTTVVPTVASTDVDLVVNNVPNLYDIIESLGGKAGILTTLPQGTQAERIAVAAAVSNSTAISDNLGETINLVNLVVQATEMPDERTGVISSVPRVVIVDDKGNSHHAMSGPLFRDLRNLLGLVGVPNIAAGDSPIKIKVVKEGKAPASYFTLKYVS